MKQFKTKRTVENVVRISFGVLLLYGIVYIVYLLVKHINWFLSVDNLNIFIISLPILFLLILLFFLFLAYVVHPLLKAINNKYENEKDISM